MKKLLASLLLAFCFVGVAKAVTTDNVKYATTASLTCAGLNSLANQSAVSCTAVDNGTNLYVDALVTVTVKTSASALVSTATVTVYVYGSEDGTNYEEENSSSPALGGNYTLNATTNYRVAAIISPASSSETLTKVFSLAQLYGGIAPRKWGILISNSTGQALNSSGNSSSYSGITFTNQ